MHSGRIDGQVEGADFDASRQPGAHRGILERVFDYGGSMEWRTRWRITIRWDAAENSPVGATLVTRECDTPAELRYLVERARADPHVTAFPYHSVRVLIGDEHTHCRAGHPYAGGSATRPVRDWSPCACGGHLILTCRCGDVRVDPPVSPDSGCRPPRAPQQARGSM